MSRFQAKPKQKSGYPTMLSRFEEKRKGDWFKGKVQNQNKSFNSLNSQRLQMFSGKKGK